MVFKVYVEPVEQNYEENIIEDENNIDMGEKPSLNIRVIDTENLDEYRG